MGHCNILEPYSHFTYQPFDVEHDESNQAFLIKHPDMGSLFYLSDAAYIPAKINGLNHLLIEANYSEDILEQNVQDGRINQRLAERIKENHLSIERLEHWLRLIDLSQLRTITLCHLSDKNSDQEWFKAKIGALTGLPVHIAEPRMSVVL
jgi:phosphoribosyl 1,2-cyclic phosphodiesterase